MSSKSSSPLQPHAELQTAHPGRRAHRQRCRLPHWLMRMRRTGLPAPRAGFGGLGLRCLSVWIRLARQIASRTAPEPTVAIARNETIDRIAPCSWNHSRRVNQLPRSSCRGYQVYPCIGLSEGPVAVHDQERQRVIGIIAVLRQQSAAELTLHGDQAKRRIALMILQPPCPTTTEVAQTIENNHSARDIHFQRS